MLDERPITQRILIGAAAFMFVFGTAMAGSAFMISGGFGFGADRSYNTAERPGVVHVTQTAMRTDDDNWFAIAPPAAASEPAPEQHVETSYYGEEELAGDASATRAEDYAASSERILRDVQRELARWSDERDTPPEPSTYSETYEAHPQYEPATYDAPAYSDDDKKPVDDYY